MSAQQKKALSNALIRTKLNAMDNFLTFVTPKALLEDSLFFPSVYTLERERIQEMEYINCYNVFGGC